MSTATPGIISAGPFAGAHAFPPAFTIQQAAGLLMSQASLLQLFALLTVNGV